MDFAKKLDQLSQELTQLERGAPHFMQRFRSEVDFAVRFAELFPDKKEEWQGLILKSVQYVKKSLDKAGAIDFESMILRAERMMRPIGKAAKEYTVHCCGHAHIDMNWMWPWQETVSVTHDTFSTVNLLMEQYPEFRFSQSQASTYIAMEEFCPEIFEMVKKRVAEGRWEPTASMWVEGDKNMASGEILCRHMLYTRRYFKEKFGLRYDKIKIDWECDTFGHCHTLPGILNRGGVTRYYRHRTGPENWLMWWKSPDGSKVLTYYDKGTYNGAIVPEISHLFVDYLKQTGLKDFMYMYGVGDHGGGPTRRDLNRARDMNTWPIYPKLLLSTTDAFFSAVETKADHLPVHDGELNFIFEGCYTSESSIKRANRVSENILPEVEAIALVSKAAARFPYPSDDLLRAWRMAMFNQFHDILPGSGVRATYTYADGMFQEIQAIAGAIRTRALRRLASRIDTATPFGLKPSRGDGGAAIGDGTGAGAGDPAIPGGVSAYNVGAPNSEPVLIFNQLAFPRSETVYAKVWNKEFPHDRISVRDENGNITKGQVVGTGNYWGHNFTTVAFPAKDVPAMGYKVFMIDRAAEPVPAEGVSMPSPGVMENEFVRVEVDMPSGAIKSLVDKSTGYDLVPEGGLLGVLEMYQEVPHGMTAWVIGQTKTQETLTQDGHFEAIQHGPHRAAVRTNRKVRDSRVSVEIGLNAGSPQIDFTVNAHWVERGTPETGVPMLRIAFPVKMAQPKAKYEIAFGSIERPVNGQEVPALKWADLSGKRVDEPGDFGLTLVNADKYGHNAKDNILRLTLLRSSYDPDNLPEIADHSIRMAIIPHDGAVSVSEAAKLGAAFNLPMNVASTDVHKGKLPPSKSFVEVLSPNVMLAAVKKAEDSRAVIVRLYEVEGKDTTAKVRISDLVREGASACEVDLMEQPLKESSAKLKGDMLTVKIPAYGIASVVIG